MKKAQKNNDYVCFLLVAICYYISAIFSMISKDGNTWTMYLCLGSAFLCIAVSYRNKNKDKEKDETEDDDDKKE